MKHQKSKNPSFGRHRGPRKALIRGLITNLVEKERIKTTVPKAKCIRPLIEKAITMGKRGDVHSTRLLLSRYPNKKTVDKIMNNLSPRFQERQGGYTRIIKLGLRSGDQAPIAYLEFVDYDNLQKSTDKKENIKTLKKSTDKTVEATAEKSKDKKPQQSMSPEKIERKRKKARLKQKKSRRINR